MFVNARSVTVNGHHVLRKAYGLGAQAMASGGFKFPMFYFMAYGRVRRNGSRRSSQIGYRKDLEAINDPEEREQAYQNLAEKMYEAGKGHTADHFEIDDVIDPQDSRQWVMAALRAAGPGEERASKNAQ